MPRHNAAINLPALVELLRVRPDLTGIGFADLAREVSA